MKNLTHDRIIVIVLCVIFAVTFFGGFRNIALVVAIIMMALFLREVFWPSRYLK